MMHHRTPQFSAELSEMLELIAPIFGTSQPVLPVHTTGRGALEVEVFERDRLLGNNTLVGPAIVEESAATTILEPGDRLTVNRFGNLVLTL